METGWPLRMIWMSFYWALAACSNLPGARSPPTNCREGEDPSFLSSGSQMEKQFITLSESLSETDMIKNNIKWIMFSSDWYHYNCQPDFCGQETCTNRNTHTLWGLETDTDAVISCLCAWVIRSHSLLQMARRLKRCGGTNDVGHVFRGEKTTINASLTFSSKQCVVVSVPVDWPNRYQLLCPLRGDQLW